MSKINISVDIDTEDIVSEITSLPDNEVASIIYKIIDENGGDDFKLDIYEQLKSDLIASNTIDDPDIDHDNAEITF